MRISLVSQDGDRSYDTALGRFTDAEAISCFRCGVCCRRWQPLVTRREAERLASYLGISSEALLKRFARPYPLEDNTHMLNNVDGGCVFLEFDAEGRAACRVHEARPQACRDWDASLLRKECLDGVRGEQAGSGSLLLVYDLVLYDDPRDVAVFRDRLRRVNPFGPATPVPPTG